MGEYVAFKEKYDNETTNQAFWVSTFKNAFTYTISEINNIKYVVLCVWDGKKGTFGIVDENYSTQHVKMFKDGVKGFRVALDNNIQLTDKEDNETYQVNANNSSYYSYGNPVVYRVGSDNYLLMKVEVGFGTGSNINAEPYKNVIVKCCVNMFGDAVNRANHEYYWNFFEDAIDTTYEHYSLDENLIEKYSKPFTIEYEAQGCRVDKYKEEDSSYIVDRYF